MTATVHLCLETNARLATYVKRANTLGSVCLVRTEGHQVDLQRLQVYLDLAGRLRRINVENDSICAREFTDRRDILNNTDLVIDVHYRNKNSLIGGSCFKRFHIQQAIFLRIQVSDGKTFTFELTAGIEYRLVLGFESDDVIAFLAIKMRSTLDRQIIRFGRTLVQTISR
jgi:hypothetical protein